MGRSKVLKLLLEEPLFSGRSAVSLYPKHDEWSIIEY